MNLHKFGYEKIKPLLDRLLVHLREKFNERMLSLTLYGSFARNTASYNSDIDLILVLDKRELTDTDKLIKVYSEIEKNSSYKTLKKEGFEIEIKTITLSKKEADENRYLFIDVSQEGIILYDKNNYFRKRTEEMRKRPKELGAKKYTLPDGSWYWDLKPDWKPKEIFEL